MERLTRTLVVCAVAAITIAVPRDARAYSVLAHEANVDALWDRAIVPLLEKRFPHATREDIRNARAYAYGGSVIQDLGYYPFGSKFFSNLLHYVRSGDFVEFALRDARTVDEYAFALGTLGHYASDTTGHPEAVNKAVALMFPKLRQKFGNTVTYVDSPASHVIVEFSFDIVQAAAGAYLPESYHQFIGFKVATPLLERAFRATYSLEMHDVLAHEDLAMSTYRKSVSELIPEITRIAWRDKREEIERLMPGVQQSAFVYRYTRQQFESEFGAQYERPGWFARFVAFLYRLVPKIGPLKPLSFKTPTPEAERLFAESFKDTRARYGSSLDAVARGRLDLANTDFDTGKPSAHGEYALADDTYAELLRRLADQHFTGVSRALQQHIIAFYAAAPDRTASRKERHRAKEVRENLAALKAYVRAP
ncbi:MAG: zinc dependent phospholipase C family protein [Acidobacteria bacterium]|nr:zinc dependent phospholipase C family protein [Acidobacteriota bacterium]